MCTQVLPVSVLASERFDRGVADAAKRSSRFRLSWQPAWPPPFTTGETLMTTLQRLDDIELLDCVGADAAAFLQSLLSNDVTELERVNAQWSALLNAQGRALIVFALIRRGLNDYVLALPHRRRDELLQRLQRWQFRRKLRLAPNLTECIVGSSGHAVIAAGSALDLRFRSGRRWYLCPTASATEYPVSNAAWHRADLIDALPLLKPAAAEHHLALALALDTLPAISFTKGCYPGQEIVARTHYLGRSKRHLASFEMSAADADIVPNAPIFDLAKQTVGEVVDAVADHPADHPAGVHRWTLLGVLAESASDGPLTVLDSAGVHHPLDPLPG